MKPDYKQLIEKKIKYAADSYSRALMYEIYGTLRGLALAGAVDNAYYLEASGRICKEYFNNATWCKECYRRADICLKHVLCDDCDLRSNCALREPGFWNKDVTDQSMDDYCGGLE